MVVAIAVIFLQQHFGCRVQITRVAFVCIDVDFQLQTVTGSHEHIVKDNAAIVAFDFQLHHVAILDAIKSSFVVIHVNVACGADDTLIQLHRASRAN